MKAMLHCTLEAHATAATLYLRGTLSTSGSLLALRCCEELPRSIRTLRVDLNGVELFHPAAVEALFTTLARWCRRRDGVTRLDIAGRREARTCVLGRVAASDDDSPAHGRTHHHAGHPAREARARDVSVAPTSSPPTQCS